MNKWVCWYGHVISDSGHPELCPKCADDHIEPLVPKYRIHGISYRGCVKSKEKGGKTLRENGKI